MPSLAGLLDDEGDQRAHDAEGRHDDDEEEDDEHHAALGGEGVEEIAVVLQPGAHAEFQSQLLLKLGLHPEGVLFGGVVQHDGEALHLFPRPLRSWNRPAT
jgi:hypothetical protein